MLQEFLTYVNNENLTNCGKPVLIAVSGGKDSMVMLDLFISSGLQVAVAHVNHNARGAESDEDQRFVENYCKERNINCHIHILDKSLSKESNFQAKARHIRYEWMASLCDTYDYVGVATGHHQDDHIESFFISLLRGAGMKGLSGIAPRRGNILRPLLNLSREDIDTYQQANTIAYREDSSNATDKYLRNKIRHDLLPILKSIDPSANANISHSMKILAEGHDLLSYFVSSDDSIVSENESTLTIKLSELQKVPSATTYLWYKLAELGFTKSDFTDMLDSGRSGALFHSNTHTALIDREVMIIKPNHLYNAEIQPAITINSVGTYDLKDGHQIQVKMVDHLEFSRIANVEILGFRSDPFPLQLRKRQDGDAFKPLGMRGKSQKVKDFIVNNKMNYNDKSKMWMLTKDDEIAYVLPNRISDSFKVTPKSKYLLEISYKVK